MDYISNSSSPSPEPEPSDSRRITENSAAYIRRLDRARIDVDRFKDCTKLGNFNHARWLRELKNRAALLGYDALLFGTEKAPVKPAESCPNREWNQYMLQTAHWLGRNQVLLICMQSTLEYHLRTLLNECKLVADALEVIENTRPGAPITIALHYMNRFMDYSPNEASTFAEFANEFESRLDDFNDLKGGFEFDEKFKCMFFLMALKKAGPDFQNWVLQLGESHRICGMGQGKELLYTDVTQLAEARWIWLGMDSEQQGVVHPSATSVGGGARRPRQHHGRGRRR